MMFLARAFSSGLISNNQLWHYCAHFCKDAVFIDVFINNSSYLFKHFCYFFDKHWFWRMLCRHQCSLVEAATQTFLYGLAWTLSHVAFQGRIAVIGMQLNSA